MTGGADVDARGADGIERTPGRVHAGDGSAGTA
jgi:hypothetical protein